MARLRLLIDLPDADSDSDQVKHLLAELLQAAGNGEGLELRTAGGRFTVEALGAQVMARAQGLVLNSVSDTDVEQAMENLRALVREEFADLYPDTVDPALTAGPATLRRVLDGVDAVFLVCEQRFATAVEAARVVAALRARLMYGH